MPDDAPMPDDVAVPNDLSVPDDASMPDDDPVARLVGGDRALASALRPALQRLADGGGGPGLQALADDILNGRITLRDLSRSTELWANVQPALNSFLKWKSDIGDVEFDRQGELARRALYGDDDPTGAGRHGDRGPQS